MSLLKKPIFWISTVAVMGALWATQPEDPAANASAAKVKKPVKKSAKKSKFQFSEEDFKAEFDRVPVQVKDVFKPIVYRGSTNNTTAANQIPTRFAGGEAGWVYTGNAEVSGVKNALLENRQTGDGVFLKIGEKWKGSVVRSISTDSVMLEFDGSQKTFRLVDEEAAAPRPAAQSNVRPLAVNVPEGMRGNFPQLPNVSVGPGMTPQGMSADNSFTPMPMPMISGGDQ